MKSYIKEHIFEIILTTLVAFMVFRINFYLNDVRKASQAKVTTKHRTLSELDSLRLNNAWLSYNDSLMRNPRKVVAAKSLKILEKERRYQNGKD